MDSDNGINIIGSQMPFNGKEINKGYVTIIIDLNRKCLEFKIENLMSDIHKNISDSLVYYPYIIIWQSYGYEICVFKQL